MGKDKDKKGNKDLKPFTFIDWEQAKALGNRVIPKKDKEEIKEAQKRFYLEEAKSLLNDKIENFQTWYNKSDDREGLIDDEIKDIDNLLFSKQFHPLYQKLIEKCDRDYTIIKVRAFYKENGDFEGYTKYIDPEFSAHIQIETSFMYKEWLKKLQKSKSTHPEDIISKENWEKLIVIGIDAGFWDQERNITLPRNSLYSSGKKFLGLLVKCLQELEVVTNKHSIDKVAEFFLIEFKIQNKLRKDPKHQYREFQRISNKSIYEKIMKVLNRGYPKYSRSTF